MNNKAIEHLYEIGNKAVKDFIEKNYKAAIEHNLFSIGCILRRKQYPTSYYALYKVGGFVRLLNVKTGKHIGENYPVYSLSDINHKTITNIEFNKMIENSGIGRDSFYQITLAEK